MGKKKGGKKKQPQKVAPKPQPMKNPLADLFGEMAKSGIANKLSPVQKMTAPPENLIEHLTRLGAQFWVAEAGVTETGDVFPEPCLTVPWMALIHAEAEHAQPGTGEQKVQEVKRLMISENAKRAVDEIQSIGGGAPNGTFTVTECDGVGLPVAVDVPTGHPDDPKHLPRTIRVNGRPIHVERRQVTCICGEFQDFPEMFPIRTTRNGDTPGKLYRLDGPCQEVERRPIPNPAQAQGVAIAEAEERRVRAQAIAEGWPGAPSSEDEYDLGKIQG